VTRWREDATCDSYGSFCYVRDVDRGALWSNAWQPTTKRTKAYEAIFTQARAEFRRTDEQIETYTQISVSPEDDIELRRVTLTNRSETPRTLQVTSYAEVVLATQVRVILDLFVKMARHDVADSVRADDVNFFDDAEVAAVDGQRTGEEIVDDHVALQVTPLVDRTTQLALLVARERMDATQLQLAVHIHLVPGNLIDPDHGADGLPVVETPPKVCSLAVNR